MPEPFNAAAVVARMGSHPTALSSDSRRIGKNCAFLAYPGDVFDGRGFIPDALSAGAVGIFWEAENFVWLSDWSVPNVAVPRLHLHVGDIADTVYHSPSEKLFTAAVTGTNGKTTVTHFAAQLCGVDKSAVIGTLGAGFLGRMQATDNTTRMPLLFTLYYQIFPPPAPNRLLLRPHRTASPKNDWPASP